VAVTFSYTYTTLKTAILDTIEDGADSASDEFLAQLDNFIGLGELRLLRDLNLETFDADAPTTTFSVGSVVLAKPADMVRERTIWYVNGSSEIVYLTPKTREYCLMYWPNRATQGEPLYYAEVDETNWEVVPTPNAARTVSFRIMKRPLGLSSTTATTFLSTYAPDLLLYACLIEAESFVTAEQLQIWKARYEEKIPGAVMELRQKSRAEFDIGR
jgi:hypothetical protein